MRLKSSILYVVCTTLLLYCQKSAVRANLFVHSLGTAASSGQMRLKSGTTLFKHGFNETDLVKSEIIKKLLPIGYIILLFGALLPWSATKRNTRKPCSLGSWLRENYDRRERIVQDQELLSWKHKSRALGVD